MSLENEYLMNFHGDIEDSRVHGIDPERFLRTPWAVVKALIFKDETPIKEEDFLTGEVQELHLNRKDKSGGLIPVPDYMVVYDSERNPLTPGGQCVFFGGRKMANRIFD